MIEIICNVKGVDCGDGGPLSMALETISAPPNNLKKGRKPSKNTVEAGAAFKLAVEAGAEQLRQGKHVVALCHAGQNR